jgi:hypothetical protein
MFYLKVKQKILQQGILLVNAAGILSLHSRIFIEEFLMGDGKWETNGVWMVNHPAPKVRL